MAQSAVGRLFRCQNSNTLRQSIGALTQRRAYSKNAIPTFPPTSSSELDQALNRFREELFVPFGLTTQQRNLMSRQKYADRLEEEPVTVAIGENDEPFTLRPMDPQSRPTNRDMVDTISLMKTPQDWQNILPFLAGLRMSHRVLKSDRWEWLVRKAGQADALGVLLECAKRSDITGFRLNHAGIVQSFFFELHRKAQRGEFKDPAVTKALSLAKQAIILMETPEHIERDVKLDPKRKPYVIGTLLELSAARAVNELGGNDEGGHVRAYAQRLLATWSLGNFSRDAKTWVNADQMLQENIPIYNGMKLALQVKEVSQDKTISSGLKTRINGLNMAITSHKEMAPEKVMQQPSRGYEQSLLLH
ncbi:hypothetical protein ASPWEDRAFT_147632 [Aspergillus wentii DTO 134E9]|uniref:Uncharacterized protein n=1 Tax=Aspergillus wentii DTO 134E9 TaxID=1073089 RepID=A0A1L9S3K5_ASPWE|nr:uncharacterized protein ASPWEDRAFT_147632 [Aspergillus wentii DTO 134E9]KAI9930072.1 hypothetical protein MW887_011882 [Aspergillus wentii]OJJ41734.1 hypothetical protein ASPWEDRAFT_147632 [Aspergillus wentii DTO 134E9]